MIGDWLARKEVCICAGSGGVGKTTTSARGAGMAAGGQEVAVLRSTPPSGSPTRSGCASSGTRAARDSCRRRGRAVGDDARPEAHLRRDRRVAHPAGGRATPCSRTGSTRSSRTRWPARRSTWRWKLDELHQEGRYDLLVLDTPPRATRSTSSTHQKPRRVHRLASAPALRRPGIRGPQGARARGPGWSSRR